VFAQWQLGFHKNSVYLYCLFFLFTLQSNQNVRPSAKRGFFKVAPEAN